MVSQQIHFTIHFYNSFIKLLQKKKSSSGPLLITFWWTTEALKVGITLLLAVIICAISKWIIRTAFQFPSLKVALDGRDEPKSPLQSTTAMTQVQYCVLQSQHRETAEHKRSTQQPRWETVLQSTVGTPLPCSLTLRTTRLQQGCTSMVSTGNVKQPLLTLPLPGPWEL